MADEEFSGATELAHKTTTKIWRVWRTTHEMCKDRGYEISDAEIQVGLDEFRRQYTGVDGLPEYVLPNPRHTTWLSREEHEDCDSRSRLKFTARPSDHMNKLHMPAPTKDTPNPDTEAGNVWVEFLNSESFGTKEIRRFIEFCSNNHYRSGILVSHLPISAAARKMISATQSFTNVEVFLEDDLLINITHHTLVPKHILLSRDEKIALLKRYRLKETQLPRILVKDPVAAYLGLKKGNVVKIIRKSETAGRYASYRICV
ncbi:DNA-directed RNA polymerasesI/II/III subunit RPABC1 [Zalerion maritima]|uniref:DNA-directed RNA polymerases I, II, and III subunit RPABC1 n=1 Tax=Zalerion maritima TaxID=339359 RepID=A0AAD5RWY6_9PEZI|nr:DNA-directed RNA polymerasesI/II/III subunit RPABC1 [Zalerion maritima]